MPGGKNRHKKPASELQRLFRGRGWRGHPFRAVCRVALFAVFILGPVLGLVLIFSRPCSP
jgi:hypothetical protein